MPSDSVIDPRFELGVSVGRRQAFGLIAHKCSAADAACLKDIRDSKLYRQAGLTWEEFCPRHLGLSRTHADRIIQQLDEFGTAYFQLSQFVRIPAEAFRAIAPAVVPDAIEYDGERIAIVAENSRRIAQVVGELRLQAAVLRRKAHPDDVRKLRAGLDLWLSRFVHSGADAARLAELADYGIERLAELSRTLR